MKRKKKKSSQSFTFKKPEPANGVFFFYILAWKNPLKRLLSHQKSLQVIFFWSIIGKPTPLGSFWSRLWVDLYWHLSLLSVLVSAVHLDAVSTHHPLPLAALLAHSPNLSHSLRPPSCQPGGGEGWRCERKGVQKLPRRLRLLWIQKHASYASHSVPPGASLCFWNLPPLISSSTPPCLMRFTPLPPPVLHFCPPSPTERGRQSRSSDEGKMWTMEERENEGLSDVIQWFLYHSCSSPNLPQMFSDMAAPPCSLNAVRGAAVR